MGSIFDRNGAFATSSSRWLPDRVLSENPDSEGDGTDEPLKMKDEETLQTIKDLIQTLEDGKEGFHEAAEASKDAEVAQVLQGYSDQRAELSAQLQTIGATYGEAAYEQDSTIAGAVHRGWIDLKAAVTSGSAHSVLAECERGEDHAVAAFRDALEKDLPSNVRTVVEQQAASVQAAHDRVKRLRDLAKAAHV
jgi:uncharacterized protein (TIGR02284 family)